jgi:hypothetical protein
VEHWLPPEVGWQKANADGAISPGEGNGGVGGDHQRSPWRSVVGRLPFFPSRDGS